MVGERAAARTGSGVERLLGMPPARFLRDYWQKRPLLIRGGLADWRDPLSPEELAGLACEDGVESRLVVTRGPRRWDVTWGPYEAERFTVLPDERWTLLVQEVNRHVPAAARLLDRFAFLPSVRVDDVMVSYAAPGGSVGPHLDSYDVFLVQGRGERRWRYGTSKVEDARFVRGLDLRILERFSPDADEVLGPGDVLYLPPGFAHHGVAETPCLTYSVGFRAPSFGEMWKERAASAAAEELGERLLEDPRLEPAENPGAIPEALLSAVRAAVRSQDGSDAAIDRWFARFATRLGPGRTLTAPRKAPTLAQVRERLRSARSAVCVVRSEEGKWAFLHAPRGRLRLYVGGVETEVARPAAALARRLCARRTFTGDDLEQHLHDREAQALIVHLFAVGGLRFARRSEVRLAR